MHKPAHELHTATLPLSTAHTNPTTRVMQTGTLRCASNNMRGPNSIARAPKDDLVYSAGISMGPQGLERHCRV